MPTSEVLTTFCLTSLVLLIVPGPSVVYAVTRTVEHGRAAGMWSVLGLESGLLIHVLAAAGGIAAVVASSAGAMTVLRVGGAAFLIGLGARQLLRRPAPESAGTARAGQTRVRMFTDGLVVDVLNPKTCLFFVAFLPQFVDPARGSVGTQTLVLGACVVVLALACDTGYALAAGSVSARLRSAAAHNRVTTVGGWVYVGLGTAALIA